jgi:protein gp37
MYPWVTHTHCHLGGECPQRCSYCYVNSFPFGRPEKYKGQLRLIEKEFDVQYGIGKTIFVENCNDLFATNVPQEFINKIIKFVTIEPVLDFDVDVLAGWIAEIRPEFLNLGADSKRNNLPEPTVEKVMELVDKLKEYGIELREKHNLQRLLK